MCLSVVAEARASNKPTDAELVAITARGRLLAEYDQAAWHATDVVLATHPKEGKLVVSPVSGCGFVRG